MVALGRALGNERLPAEPGLAKGKKPLYGFLFERYGLCFESLPENSAVQASLHHGRKSTVARQSSRPNRPRKCPEVYPVLPPAVHAHRQMRAAPDKNIKNT